MSKKNANGAGTIRQRSEVTGSGDCVRVSLRRWMWDTITGYVRCSPVINVLIFMSGTERSSYRNPL